MRPELMLAFLTAYREVKGPKRCRELVGPMRKILAPRVVSLAGDAVEPQGTDAATMASHCRSCGRCRLGRDP